MKQGTKTAKSWWVSAHCNYRINGYHQENLSILNTMGRCWGIRLQYPERLVGLHLVLELRESTNNLLASFLSCLERYGEVRAASLYHERDKFHCLEQNTPSRLPDKSLLYFSLIRFNRLTLYKQSYLSILLSYGHFLTAEKINDFGEDDWQTVLYGQVGKASAEQSKRYRLSLRQGTLRHYPEKRKEGVSLCSHKGMYSKWGNSASAILWCFSTLGLAVHWCSYQSLRHKYHKLPLSLSL